MFCINECRPKSFYKIIFIIDRHPIKPLYQSLIGVLFLDVRLIFLILNNISNQEGCRDQKHDTHSLNCATWVPHRVRPSLTSAMTLPDIFRLLNLVISLKINCHFNLKFSLIFLENFDLKSFKIFF